MAPAISIRVPLAGHDPTHRAIFAFINISIRVPLAGHDLTAQVKDMIPRLISIRVPLAGHDICPRRVLV